jgi:dTDP-glucose 4,6-dehydratase
MLATREDVEIINFDKLTYAGNIERLANITSDERHQFVQADICDGEVVKEFFSAVRFDALVNFAAETHVDRSIQDASPFVRTNVVGTQSLLEAALRVRLPRFVQISTDEVYGSAFAGESFTEAAPLNPRNPYAASKAGADHLVRAYVNTYGFPAIILRCSNNYGPFQFPEKLIPLIIANAQEDKPIPVYGDGQQERDWLFVEDYCRAIALALEKAEAGTIYNVSGGKPQRNLDVVRTILRQLGKPDSLIEHVQDRLGHDRRYALDSSKIQRELGWMRQTNFEEGIQKTVEWYRANPAWLQRLRCNEFRKNCDRQYMRREETLSPK